MELLLVDFIQNEPAECGGGAVGERHALLGLSTAHPATVVQHQSLVKRRGQRFESEMLSLLCLLYMKGC